MNTQQTIDTINQMIVNELKSGTVAWHKGWNIRRHQNLATKHAYSGINRLITAIVADKYSYKSPYWLTFLQVQEKGGMVKKGAKGSPIIYTGSAFYLNGKWISERTYNNLDLATQRTVTVSPIIRHSFIFNLDVIENITAPEETTAQSLTPIEKAEQIIQNYKTIPLIITGGNRAYYSPKKDTITLPLSFLTREDYYATLFHEMVHSTGHATRVNRSEVMNTTHFGSGTYQVEELTAEIGASYLLNEAGITTTLKNSAAYINGWLGAFEKNKMLFFKAAASAEKAFTYIIS